MIVTATFTSVWNDDIDVTTGCSVNMETREVFDIKTDDSSVVESLNSLEYEYITMNGIDYSVFPKEEAEDGDYWYSDDES